MSPRLRSTSAILIAFAVPLGVYLASLRGEVSFWDTADLQTVPYILGIPYPTGFPGYTLVGWVWSHAFAVGNVAWRLNVLGAIACAGTCAAVAGLLISLGAATAIGFGAALAYGLAAVPWRHATYVDVHPLAFCAAAWAAVYAVRWARSKIVFDAVLCTIACVIALGCDNTTALMLPGLAFMVFGRRLPWRPALVLIVSSAAMLIAVYAYLPLRSANVTAARIDPTLALGVAPGRPYWDDGHPASWDGFLRVVTGSDFAPHEAVAGMMSPDAVHHVVDDFAPMIFHDLGGFMPWLALFGLAMLWWRLPLVLAGLLLMGMLPLLFASAYVVESEATRYYLPAYFTIAVGGGYAVAVFDAAMHGVQRYAMLGVVLLAWGALLSTDFMASNDLFTQPHDVGSRAWIRRVARETPPHAVVVAPWNFATPLAYGTYVLHELGDRIILTAGAHEYQSQYRNWMRQRPVVVVSETKQHFTGFHVTEIDVGDPISTSFVSVPERRAALIRATIAGIAAFAFALVLSRFRSSPYNGYVLLAQAFVHGHIAIAWPGSWIDALPYAGQYWVIEAPTPAALLVPWVALFGSANQTLLSVLLCGVSIGACWLTCEQLGVSKRVNTWLCAFMFAGTQLAWSAELGDIWFIAHVSSVAFAFLALAELTGKRRGSLIALALVAAVFSRFAVVMAIPVFAWLVVRDRTPETRRRAAIGFSAVIALGAVVWVTYNLARWGTWYDIGYTAWYHQDTAGSPDGSPFQLRYFTYQLWSFFVMGPEFKSQFPFVVPTFNGLAMTWTSPALVIALFARRPRALAIGMWAAALLVAGPSFIYYVNGYAQFGMRHALDFEPFLIVLMALAIPARMPLLANVLIGWSVLVGFWGIWFWNVFYRQ